MKYYSDITNKVYDTEELLIKDEKAKLDEKKAKEEAENKKSVLRAAKAKEVSEAHDKMVAARKEYTEKLTEFCEQFGYYHTSYNKNTVDKFIDALFSL